MNARKLIVICNLGLLIVWALMITKLGLLPAHLKTALRPATLQAQQSQKIFEEKPEDINHQSLADSDLFGPLKTSQSITDSPTPTLTLDHLQLQGTVIGPEIATRAFIKNKATQTSQIYKLNDWIDDAQLIKVTRNQVILKQNDQWLKLERTEEKSTDAPPVKTTKTPSPTQPLPQTARKVFTDEIEVVLKAATLTPAKITNQDKTPGITLSRIGQYLSAQNAGLKENDIIQSINGHQITSKQQMFQVLQKAKTEPVIDIEIYRDGQTILLSFDQEKDT